MRKIKKGDEVIILTGKSKGVCGRVLRTLEKGVRVIVEGANLVKKHVKPNPNANIPGGIVEREASLHISNVAIITKNGSTSRIGFEIRDGKKVRIAKKTGEVL